MGHNNQFSHTDTDRKIHMYERKSIIVRLISMITNASTDSRKSFLAYHFFTSLVCKVSDQGELLSSFYIIVSNQRKREQKRKWKTNLRNYKEKVIVYGENRGWLNSGCILRGSWDRECKLPHGLIPDESKLLPKSQSSQCRNWTISSLNIFLTCWTI